VQGSRAAGTRVRTVELYVHERAAFALNSKNAVPANGPVTSSLYFAIPGGVCADAGCALPADARHCSALVAPCAAPPKTSTARTTTITGLEALRMTPPPRRPAPRTVGSLDPEGQWAHSLRLHPSGVRPTLGLRATIVQCDARLGG
jgi:hypothetical protein